MNRTTQRKVSRALVAGLGVTVALGGVFWLGKIVGSASSREQGRAERGETTEAVVAAVAAASPAENDPGSAAAPATRPSNDLFASNLSQASILQTPTEPSAPTAPTAPLATESPSTQPSPSVTDAPPILAASTTRPSQLAFAPQGAQRGVAGDAELVIGNALADARSNMEHGKILDARRILNNAVTSNQLSDADLKAAKQMLSEINAVVVFSTKHFPGDEFGGTFTVPPNGVLEKIAKSHGVSTELLQRINGISDPRKLRAQQTIKVIKGPIHAVVDKSDFTLELWIGEPNAKGSMYVTSLPVGLGENDSTPTGVWAVKNRLNNPAYFSPRGEGIIDADDPKNPLGERWIGLTGSEGDAVGKESYGIHGTIEPESIGKQASMGCIRLTNEDVAKVFDALVKDKSSVIVRE